MRIAAVLIELEAIDHFFGEELVDEIDVVVDAADFEDFFAAFAGVFLVPAAGSTEGVEFFEFFSVAAVVPAVFDVAEEFDADFVGVEVAGGHVDGAGVVVGVVDDFGGIEVVPRHHGGVPVGGPAFVHDLGHALRGEVVGLVADDGEDVGLPGLERGVLEEEEEDVADGFGGDDFALAVGLRFHAGAFFLHEFARVDEAVHVGFGLEARGGFLGAVDVGIGEGFVGPPQPAFEEDGVGVDEVFDGEADVEEFFDAFEAEAFDVFADAGGVVGHAVHHLAVGLGEPEVDFEEIAMAVNVGHDEFLIHDGVGFLEVGVAGIVVDDHFVDASETVVVLLGHAFVFHAEAPVGVADGEAAEGGDLIDLVVVEHFEDGFEEVESVGFGGGANLFVGGGEIWGELGDLAGGGTEHAVLR